VARGRIVQHHVQQSNVGEAAQRRVKRTAGRGRGFGQESGSGVRGRALATAGSSEFGAPPGSRTLTPTPLPAGEGLGKPASSRICSPASGLPHGMRPRLRSEVQSRRLGIRQICADSGSRPQMTAGVFQRTAKHVGRNPRSGFRRELPARPRTRRCSAEESKDGLRHETHHRRGSAMASCLSLSYGFGLRSAESVSNT
jgi:hypothetical protein